MSATKHLRSRKRQLGQFFTPDALARELVAELPLTADSYVLEPSFGAGAFLLPLLERLRPLHGGRLRRALRFLYGAELDRRAHARALESLAAKHGALPPEHHLARADFLLADFPLPGGRGFDLIVGNPPFGGTLPRASQDLLERRYGRRDGLKIKKETYSYFLVRCAELLAPGGRLRFLCSDTVLTIPTMRGLREFLLERGEVSVRHLRERFEGVAQRMVVLDFVRGRRSEALRVDERELPRSLVELTGNRSWNVFPGLERYFTGRTLGEVAQCTSGMTVGRNELFVREVREGYVLEPYRFEFFEEPVTVRGALERARLGKLAPWRVRQLEELEAQGKTLRNVRALPRKRPLRVALPHEDYRYYNKASAALVYAPPAHAVYWRDDGDAVRTFKRNGNWYLRGVGGEPFFGREGLTWRLVSNTLDARYLPSGYVLDSGAPSLFLRDGVPREELWFLLGWMLTARCSALLKGVLNHTRNAQSKDVERLPYPSWVGHDARLEAERRVQELVRRAQAGERFTREEPAELVCVERLYERG